VCSTRSFSRDRISELRRESRGVIGDERVTLADFIASAGARAVHRDGCRSGIFSISWPQLKALCDLHDADASRTCSN
jgi:hypothetical protein